VKVQRPGEWPEREGGSVPARGEEGCGAVCVHGQVGQAAVVQVDGKMKRVVWWAVVGEGMQAGAGRGWGGGVGGGGGQVVGMGRWGGSGGQRGVV